MSFSRPYLLTATRAVLVSLYTFDVPDKQGEEAVEGSAGENHQDTSKRDGPSLPAPYLVTSLKSHNSNPPLALSIRKTANATIASIAYTFFTRRGWSIGIQDLHITLAAKPRSAPDISTRLAYTAPFIHDRPAQSNLLPILPSISPLTNHTVPALAHARRRALQAPPQTHPQTAAGPTTLCYTHPYLLATLPDNTLILHLCTSNASALSISPGIRLWGHTSGISDAEITARGKAVSVSSRGDEMRVWELEGRPSGVRSRSVQIRPSAAGDTKRGPEAAVAKEGKEIQGLDWEERRNWVGFDDEMVIVLKEAKGGRESLLVYDFT
ncbi:hypothetical protein M406DRAFT_358671 [Cryphonectria parasitica EP155]|uniref:Uncharacterized protein n=1 Tax=Cryphonectria parasitica (strain ATCC 38755 / EP155) TaxID=660469 RepID=A0A9P4XSJ7_CRYP1|nr:uncharacterized protein M406DRAFT_358671 [Cryphonectria parasitica EP155]KAF3759985.1 hypothetical protein M406DRAFT_358671 [Cryphonectria parasitica EP155]